MRWHALTQAGTRYYPGDRCCLHGDSITGQLYNEYYLLLLVLSAVEIKDSSTFMERFTVIAVAAASERLMLPELHKGGGGGKGEKGGRTRVVVQKNGGETMAL